VSVAALRRLLRIIVLLVLWGLITHSTHAGSGDEPHYLAITHSIAFDRDLNLANNYGPSEPLIAGGGLESAGHVRTLADGVVRPVHDIGMPLLFAPAARLLVPLVNWMSRTVSPDMMRRARLTPTVLYRHGLSFVMIGFATVLAGLMFDTLVGRGAPPKQAFGVALLMCLSPPLLFYSVLFFTELLSALLCFWVFRRLIWTDIRGPVHWGLTGAATGFLMLVHARNAGLVVALAALGAVKVWRSGSRGEVGAFAVGVAALLLVRTAVNSYFWGTLVTNSHASLGAWNGWRETTRESFMRLGGLLTDQEFGLLVYAPVYALGAAGLVDILRTDRAAARAILFVIGCYLALVICPLTNVQGWTGGWCPAGRFLAPIVPLLAVPLSLALRAAPRVIVVGVLTLQIGINVFLWQAPKLAWTDGDGRAAFCDRISAAVCAYLPSFTVRGS
jgi:hypothetical protein